MKILSIDFDAIMFPCIRLYNEYCSGNDNDTEIWNRLEFERNISQYFQYDANVYQNITEIIMRNIKQGAKFIPIKEHQKIVDYLKNSNLLSEDLTITNIDYHHDIAYNSNSFIMMDFDEYNCADWAGYLLMKNPNNSLLWLRCPGSTPFDTNLHDFSNEITTKRIDEILNLSDNYDLIFFCLSPQWVPYTYHHLYNNIINIIRLLFPNQLISTIPPKPITKQEQPQEIIIEKECIGTISQESSEPILIQQEVYTAEPILIEGPILEEK